MALTVTYAMTCGRSWKTGEKIKFDGAMLHHILHDETGHTLYGVDYENKYEYFACLKDDGENNEVERADKQQEWENTFVNMWRLFKEGDFKKATAHWDSKNRKEFLAERRQSKRYLDYWLGML